MFVARLQMRGIDQPPRSIWEPHGDRPWFTLRLPLVRHMTAVDRLALALGAGWASGLNLYAAVLALGYFNATGDLLLPPDCGSSTTRW